MDGVALRRHRRVNDGFDLEVAFGRPRGADADRAIGHSRGHAVPVGGRRGEHGFDAEVAARADDADGDFAAIRDEDAPDGHGVSPLLRTRRSGCSNSTSAPSVTKRSVTVPRTPARTVFISFMTSMMAMMVSASTLAPTSTKGERRVSGSGRRCPAVGR